MADTTLAINAGSSGVKCGLFTFEAEPCLIDRGVVSGTGDAVVAGAVAWASAQSAGTSLAAIGHRIVHGGPDYRDPEPITPAVVAALTALIPFAPNHLPAEIALIQAFQHHQPAVPQVACFDTAFHQTMPETARRLAIPSVYDDRGIRRYGFHGLSYSYVLEELRRVAGNDRAAGRVIIAHLGNGSSVAAVHHGRSVDTTMAFTPIAGVVMSTRTGDLDPGVVTYLARTERLSPDELEDLLSRRSGLLAISGTTGDMQQLLAGEATDAGCRLAVEIYVYSVTKAVGALAAALRGVDTLVFSGGIGEHSAAIRARICEAFAFLGLELDAAGNDAHAPVVSASGSRVVVRVIPTNEELIIARAAYRALAPR